MAKHRDEHTHKWKPEFVRMIATLDVDRPHILKAAKRAMANGLSITQRTRYIECYLLNELHGCGGLATMMLPGYDWETYLEDLLSDPDVICVGVDEDGLPAQGARQEDPPPSTSRTKGKKTMATDETLPQGEEGISASEGDKYRREIRKLAEEMGYELTETGGAVTCKDGGDIVAICGYKRGTKNGAWKAVHEQLSVLL